MKVLAVFILSLAILRTANAFPSAVRLSLYFLIDHTAIKNSQQAFNDPGIYQRLANRYGVDLPPKQDIVTRENVLSARDASLGDTVDGLLNGSLPGTTLPSIIMPGLGHIVIDVPPVVTIGRKVIPDANHPFQDPPLGAQRGGCPGLNGKSI